MSNNYQWSIVRHLLVNLNTYVKHVLGTHVGFHHSPHQHFDSFISCIHLFASLCLPHLSTRIGTKTELIFLNRQLKNLYKMASEEPMTPVEYVINTLKVRFVELSVLVHHLRTSSNLCNAYEFRLSLLSRLCWRWDMFCLQLLNRKRTKEGNETRSQILKWMVTQSKSVVTRRARIPRVAAGISF